MPQISSYVEHLPPILWSQENDPPQFLGRMLRIFEKVLTGIDIDAEVIRASAAIAQAAGDRIALANPSDAARFRGGDIVTIEGTAERVQVQGVEDGVLLLAASLAAPANGGAVRIADLIPEQRVFRIRTKTPLGSGEMVMLRQGGMAEIATVESVNGEFLHLRTGLVNGYTLGADDVLVRLSDGLPLVSGDRHYISVKERIDGLHRLFSPWHTEAEFLPWLASWVALTLRKDWSDYQRRKLIADMVAIYQQRGLKRGLLTHLDIFAVTRVRPRIVIDDSEAIFRARFQPNGDAKLHALAYSTNYQGATGPATALLHPAAIGVDSENRYIIADLGDIQELRQPSIWRISDTGEFDYETTGDRRLPRPIYQRQQGANLTLDKPVAIVVHNDDRYAVLDVGQGNSDSAIYRFAPPDYALTTVVNRASTPSFASVLPVDMILDGDENFVVLDRGGRTFGDPPVGPSAPRILTVSENPLDVQVRALDDLPDGDRANVIEPTAIVMDHMGRLLVTDARDQYSETPANLIRVDPVTGSRQALLPDEGNPLIYPTGLVFESRESLLVCDVGLKRGYTTEKRDARFMAEDPAIYRVDLSQSPPVITRITHERKLVHPTGIAIDAHGNLIISDRGQSLRSAQERNWRTRPYEFGVNVIFSLQRPAHDDAMQAQQIRRQMRHAIFTLIDEQKPGHTFYWLTS